MKGAGRYDVECTAVRAACKAKGIILIVIDGDRGRGFEAQLPAELIPHLPTILREVADQIIPSA